MEADPTPFSPTHLPDEAADLQAIITGLHQKLIRQNEELNERNVRLSQSQARAFEYQAMIARQDARIGQLEQRQQEMEQKQQEMEQRQQQLELDKLRLEHQLELYKKRYYGPRADKAETSQLLLEFACELENRPVEVEIVPSGGCDHPRRVGRGRRNLRLFEALPVVRKIHDLPESSKRELAAKGKVVELAPEITWQVEYLPGSFVRIEHIQKKYALVPADRVELIESPVIQAPKPSEGLSKCLAGPGLLAYVVVSKYGDYLPLYRLEGIFERNGLEIDRSTLCLWCGDVAEMVYPVWRLMKERVLSGHVVATDDTIMPLLAPVKARQARMWIYRGDDQNPYNLFDFTNSRCRDGPDDFLGDYRGVLLADAYGAYGGICTQKRITQAGCWAHARRKFVDCGQLLPEVCQEALGLIGKLFAVEKLARDRELAPAGRLALRREVSGPVILELGARLEEWRQRLLPKHPVSQAVGYALNQWKPLTAFLGDGAIPLDNNLAEQEMKRIALLRKNALFVATERGGRTAAVLSSLTSTCRRLGVNPQRYLTQLLVNLPGTPMSQVGHWLPDVWHKRMAETGQTTNH